MQSSLRQARCVPSLSRLLWWRNETASQRGGGGGENVLAPSLCCPSFSFTIFAQQGAGADALLRETWGSSVTASWAEGDSGPADGRAGLWTGPPPPHSQEAEAGRAFNPGLLGNDLGSEARPCSLQSQIDGCCPFLSRRIDLCCAVSCGLFWSDGPGAHDEQGTYFSPKSHGAQSALREGQRNVEAGLAEPGFPGSRACLPRNRGVSRLAVQPTAAHPTRAHGPLSRPQPSAPARAAGQTNTVTLNEGPRESFQLLPPGRWKPMMTLSACVTPTPFSFP